MQSAESILTSKNKFHINLGLARTLEALENLGNPQNDINFIHVAGTNGKGSVCALLNEILCTHFLNTDVKIGLFTSPHLFSYCERIKVNNENISQDELDKYIKIASDSQDELTEFEILTVAAFLYFKDKNVKYVVLEVGLGGKFDSTNVIKNTLCSVITTIDYDHTARLGNTIEEIAHQKAGIIKQNCPVVIGCDNLGLDVVKKYASDFNAPLYEVKSLVKPSFSTISINNKEYDFSLLGDYQTKNLALVLETLKSLPFKVSEETLKMALKNVRWKFRLEYDKEKKLLIDGAHNPSGIKALREFLDKYFPDDKKTFIFGCLNNKDYENMLNELILPDDEFYFYEFDYPNALKFEQLPDKIKVRAKKILNPFEILESRKNLKIVCGSLYMLGRLFDPR